MVIFVKKKGDISIQVIVVAILALLVLVILSVMFISKTSKWSLNVNSCDAKGGKCLASCTDGYQEYTFANGDCEKQTSGARTKCCLMLDEGSGFSNTVSQT